MTMRIATAAWLAVLVVATSPLPSWPQLALGLGLPEPVRLWGDWRPVPGMGAAYTVVARSGPLVDFEITVVDQETVGGERGYWVEISRHAPEGFTVTKLLIVGDLQSVWSLQRMITKVGDEPAHEIPPGLLPLRSGPPPNSVAQERLGSERITVAAGTFVAEHVSYRGPEVQTDVWVADGVSPIGAVKVVTPEAEMFLRRVITGARTRITETPQMDRLSAPPETSVPPAGPARR